MRLPVAGYDTLEEYVAGTLYEALTDDNYELANNTQEGWDRVLTLLGEPTNKGMRANQIMTLWSVKKPAELAEVYDKFKLEINDLLADHRMGDNIRVNTMENPIFDMKNGWTWDDEDALIFRGTNKGLVARLALILTLENMYKTMQEVGFESPYEYSDVPEEIEE